MAAQSHREPRKMAAEVRKDLEERKDPEVRKVDMNFSRFNLLSGNLLSLDIAELDGIDIIII